MIHRYTTLLLLLTLVMLGGTGVARAHQPAGAVLIHMTAAGFEPSQLEIAPHTTVVFENTDTRDRWPASNIHPTHDIYPEFDPTRPLTPGESWSFTFDKVGTWRMHDHLLPQFTGVVTVTGETRITRWTRARQVVVLFFTRVRGFFTRPGSDTATLAIAKDSTAIFNDKGQLQAYIQKFGPKQTILRLHELSSQFGDCHQVAHDAGRLSYELEGNAVFKQCSAECHSGCYHGATEAFFHKNGTANVAKNVSVICDSEANPFQSHQCFHGIGHGLTAWSDYDLPAALKDCDLLPHGRESCYTGVFMENVVGGLSDDKDKSTGHFTTYLSDDPHYPCTVVDAAYKASCYFYQSSRMVQLFKSDFSKVAHACLEAPAAYHQSCFLSMGRDVGGVNRRNAEGAINACSAAPAGPLRADCLMGAVQDSFWDAAGQDDALQFCRLVTDTTEKRSCYMTIFERAPQVLTTPKELKQFCAKAEADYQSLCPG